MMKNEFRQSHRHPGFYLLVGLAAATLASSLWSGNLLILNVLVPLAACMTYFFRRYRITDDGFLTGGAQIAVASIRKIVVQKDRTEIYFCREAGGKMKIAPFFPADSRGFVAALKAVNPDIEVI